MKFYIENNKIIIPNHKDFSAKQTLECGQVFRFKETTYGYDVYSKHHKASVYCQKHQTVIECSDVDYFINYFDLHTDYGIIKEQLKSDKLLSVAISYGEGIRILKQDPLETILSFIISANNNIPRIKQIIESICENFGTKINNEYYAFPTLEQLKEIPLEFFSKIKAGYRDKYLYKTIQMISNGFDLEVVNTLSGEEGGKYLEKLSGVGPKVADCILLFGFYVTDIFPTDTWIRKVYYDYLNQPVPEKHVDAKIVRSYFVNKFGSLSGYAQQYLFYYKRENS